MATVSYEFNKCGKDIENLAYNLQVSRKLFRYSPNQPPPNK